MRGLIAKVASIILAILALGATTALVIGQFRSGGKSVDPAAAHTPLPAPESRSDGDISFAQ